MQDPTIRSPWLDVKLYPFRSHFMEIDGNQIHFVDEGSGPTLLLLHGNPSGPFYTGTLSVGFRINFDAWQLTTRDLV